MEFWWFHKFMSGPWSVVCSYVAIGSLFRCFEASSMDPTGLSNAAYAFGQCFEVDAWKTWKWIKWNDEWHAKERRFISMQCLWPTSTLTYSQNLSWNQSHECLVPCAQLTILHYMQLYTSRLRTYGHCLCVWWSLLGFRQCHEMAPTLQVVMIWRIT